MMAAGNYTDSNVSDLVMIPLSDYNQTEGKNVKLNENEILLYHRNHKNSDTKKKIKRLFSWETVHIQWLLN